MITSLIAGYEVDFVVVIKYELHERAFGDLITMPFYCLTQLLCDKERVLEILDINRRIKMMSVAQTSMIKNLANQIYALRARAPPTLISAQSEALSILAEHVDRMDIDVDDAAVHVEFEMGEHIDVPEMSTQGEGA